MRFFVVILFFVFLVSCGVRTSENFYLLNYVTPKDPQFLIKYKNKVPLQYSVQVDEFETSRLLERKSIIIRESMHKLHYDKKNKWAIKPNKAIRSLISDQIKGYDVFQECSEEFFKRDPDLFIGGKINNIELYSSEDSYFAYVDIEIILKDKLENVLFSYRINRREDLFNRNFVYFVKSISDVLKEEVDKFIVKTLDFLISGKG
ncbi:MAG: hypothetical protein CR982_08355 [Candidatus Cloacimonadota bacterium]|nr:MAG: hypothetical protein CR982_08355 [Candidatus Cloacimonadota bacterium]PIE79063.1 MAG: hypothetical protein CSA15_04800 [Candidatus Delongbacteria bacterium]